MQLLGVPNTDGYTYIRRPYWPEDVFLQVVFDNGYLLDFGYLHVPKYENNIRTDRTVVFPVLLTTFVYDPTVLGRKGLMPEFEGDDWEEFKED